VDTDSILDEIHGQAQLLQTPDKRVTDKCTVGTLGAELEETVQTLAAAIKTVKGKVEGEVEEYTKKDAVVKGAKTAGSLVSSLVSVAIKTLIVLVLLALGPCFRCDHGQSGSLQNRLPDSASIARAQIACLRGRDSCGQAESSRADDLTRQSWDMDHNVSSRSGQKVHKWAEITETRENDS
jgi:hypothetical protein